MHLSAYVYHISFRRYRPRPLNLPLNCESANKVVLGPRFVREGIRQVSDMHFQITLTSDHVAGYGLVPFAELRDKRAKKKKERSRKKELESLVKYKSADNYVGRPNETNVQFRH